VDRQIEVLSEMVDELLLYAELDLLPKRVKTIRFEARALIDEAVALIALGAEVRHVRIEVDAHGELNVDKKLFLRTLGNVLENALKYSPEGGSVRVQCQAHTVVVEDQGPGVPESELANIFRPFYRVDSARARESGGTGLGLAIVSRSMAAHGGSAE